MTRPCKVYVTYEWTGEADSEKAAVDRCLDFGTVTDWDVEWATPVEQATLPLEPAA